MPTIRELKAEISNLHKKYGALACKAKFGKTWSRMTKAELMAAIDWIKNEVIQHKKGTWNTTLSDSGRISMVFCDGIIHTVSIGFRTETEAYKLLEYGFKKDSFQAAVIRKCKRTAYRFELKIWGITPKFLATLIIKDRGLIPDSKVSKKVYEFVAVSVH